MFNRRPEVKAVVALLVLMLASIAAPSNQASPAKKLKKLTKAFEQECLIAHNKWRRLHQAGDLKFDTKIAAFAQKRANFIADSDGAEFKHPDDLPYGENLAWHSRETRSCADLIKMWYDEINLYDFKRAQFDHETGHFTQLVWRETERVGCARAISTGKQGGVYLVCNYDPPGNFLGEAAENVRPMIEAGARRAEPPLPGDQADEPTTTAPSRRDGQTVPTTPASIPTGSRANPSPVPSTTTQTSKSLPMGFGISNSTVASNTTSLTTSSSSSMSTSSTGGSTSTTKKPSEQNKKKKNKKKKNKKKKKKSNKKKGNKKPLNSTLVDSTTPTPPTLITTTLGNL